MLRLLTIPISHYCEKARWALDRAGIAYDEERHVQGVHQVVARRAGGGMTVPVLLEADGTLIARESEDVLRYADGRLEEPYRLFPADPGLRGEVEALSRRLDEGLGPDGRRWIYAQMLPLKDLMLAYNNQGVPAWEARMLTTLFPVIARYAKWHLSIGDHTIRDDGPRVLRVFDEIAERLADGRPYLCGDRFTAADLTFAALSAPVVSPPGYGIRLPDPADLPEPLAGQITEFREHPAGAFALRLFRQERPAR